MTTAVTYPADPVTNGASEIQTTNFALVNADYMSVPFSAVRLFMTRSGVAKLDMLPNMQNGNVDPTWAFFLRKDLVGTDATSRNLIGVHVVTTTTPATSFSVSLGRAFSLPIVAHRVEVYNWSPARLTLTDGTVLTRWTVSFAAYNFVVDPESGSLLYGDGASRALYEAVNFVLTPVAANKPVATPALALVTGISPV